MDSERSDRDDLVKAISRLAETIDRLAGMGDSKQAILDRIDKLEGKIMPAIADLATVLTAIDTATTKAGVQIQAIADSTAASAATTQTISDEVDALVTALQNQGVPQAIIDQATALGAKTDALNAALDADSAALTAHATFLTQIASKGAANPVPVPVPPPPTPPPTGRK